MLALCLVLFAIPLEATQRMRAERREKPIDLVRLTADAAAAELGSGDSGARDRLQALVRATKRTLEPDDLARVLIVDAGGRLIADTDLAEAPTSPMAFKREELVLALRGRFDQRTRYSRDLKAEIRLTAAPIERGTLGAARITEGVAAIDARVAVQRRRVLVLSAIVAGSTLAVAMVLARLFARPLRSLDASVRRLSGGDFSARAAVVGSREQRVLATTFNDMSRRLEQMIDSQRAFVANASHQLRSPLTGLRLRLELLRRVAADNATATRHADAALREIDRLSGTVAELLVLSRLEQTQPEPAVVDLNQVAESAVRRWQTAAGQAGLRLRTRLHDTPCVVDCAPGDLERAIDALLENAIAYSRRGGTIEVATGPTRLDVSDEGPGLAEGEEEHVFERFRRGRAARNTPAGTGLGLAITREALERNGGSAGITNRAQGGARATLHLPERQRVKASDFTST